MSNKLQITEIYASVQGESSFAGYPCVFIRLTGCPLRCRWCDTAYGFSGGEEMTLDQVVEKAGSYQIPLVELTGGEPLAQGGAIPLLQRLVKKHRVLIETGGSEPIDEIPHEVHVIMDIKCPDSGMSDRNLWSNIEALKRSDEVKFVIASREDFEWAAMMIQEYRLHLRSQVLLSPAFGLCKPADLVEWMLAENVPARLNMQIHKTIWSPRAKGV